MEQIIGISCSIIFHPCQLCWYNPFSTQILVSMIPRSRGCFGRSRNVFALGLHTGLVGSTYMIFFREVHVGLFYYLSPENPVAPWLVLISTLLRTKHISCIISPRHAWFDRCSPLLHDRDWPVVPRLRSVCGWGPKPVAVTIEWRWSLAHTRLGRPGWGWHMQPQALFWSWSRNWTGNPLNTERAIWSNLPEYKLPGVT